MGALTLVLQSMLQRFCLVALAAIALATSLMGRATALPDSGAPAVSEQSSISREAEKLFPEIDRRTAFSDLAPLRTSPLLPGDLEIRIWEGFSVVQTSGYIFRRTASIWTGTYLGFPSPTLQPSHFQMPLPAPKSGWDKMWASMEKEGIETLPDQADRKSDGRDVVDGVGYLVEIASEKGYRAYSYSNPRDHKGSENRHMAAIARTLQDAIDWKTIYRDATQSGIASLAPEVERHLLGDDFQEFHDVNKIPEWVKADFGYPRQDYSFAMANPDAEWQESDVILKPGLPFMRLIFVATSGDYCLLAWETGGIVASHKVALFRKANAAGFASIVEGSTSPFEERIKSVADVRALQKAYGAFRVRPYAL